MKGQDTYKEVREYVYPNAIVRVHIPDLTAEERARRMQVIRKATEDFLRVVEEYERKKKEEQCERCVDIPVHNSDRGSSLLLDGTACVP